MGNVKLTLSNAGHNRWRLGLLGDAYRYVVEFPLDKIIVRLPGKNDIIVTALATYKHGSITNPKINSWIIEKGWTRIEKDKVKMLSFRFSYYNGVHVYEYLGK